MTQYSFVSLNILFFFVAYCLYFSYSLRFGLPNRLRTRLSATTPLVANGKRVEAQPGSSLMAACNQLGLRVPTSCKKGECGTCTVTVAGNKMRACIGKVPPAPKLKSLIEKGLSVSVDN